MCPTLLSLEPVKIADREGALLTTAIRVLLETVASDDQERDVRAGAALAGIAPPHTGKGVRLEPGAGERDSNAGSILGRVGKTAYTHRLKYFRAYARAVMTYAQHAGRYPDVLAAYLKAVGLDEPTISRVIKRSQTPTSNLDHLGATARLAPAPTIPYSSPLIKALEAARVACETADNKLFTPHLLFALLEMPQSKAARCFNLVQPGLAQRLRLGLRAYIASAIVNEQFPAFEPFDWADRADFKRAQEVAASLGALTLTDLHLLLGMLESESSTRQQLADLGADLDLVTQLANDLLGDTRQSLTPGSIPWTAHP